MRASSRPERCYRSLQVSRLWWTEQGQTSAEYLGLLLVVAAIVAAISASGIADTVTGAISRGTCEVAQGGMDCEADRQTQAQHETPRTATVNGAYARFEQRRVELARQSYALASDTATVGARRPPEPPAGQADDGAYRVGAYRALERWSPTSRVPQFALPAERERLVTSGAFNRFLRTDLGARTPTPGDADGDGLTDSRPVSQREEGNAGDRFAGELCGIGESVAFGVFKEPACSLGDSSTQGFRQGRNLGESVAFFAPEPSRVTKVTRSRPGTGGAAPRAARPSSPPTRPRPHANPPAPRQQRGGPLAGPSLKPHGGTPLQGPHGAPSLPPRAQPGIRSGTRRSRAERAALPERSARRPSQDQETLLYKFDGGRPLELGPGQQGLDLPRLRTPAGDLDVRALYRQNMGQLREAMRSRRPIRERDPRFIRKDPRDGGAFLESERELLSERGWSREGDTWYPPSD